MYWWWHWDPQWYGTWASAHEHRRAEPVLGEGQTSTPAAAVARALLEDPDINAGQIEIGFQNGVVILDGQVDSETARTAAGRVPWSVPGVIDVCNALEILSPEDHRP
ncbi:BON domain-containing protein [Actinoplanes sp. NPDC023714]|uniref:BON domain-containing protein n=1 Tax=Actinoplanes sp. NPDC023714 TaxID=3154322 RepID=UPI0033DA61FF